jgi:YidC/Oxa1 family membrane protein insertase
LQLAYAGVDSPYFSTILIPQHKEPGDFWHDELVPRRVGTLPKRRDNPRLANVSCRLTSLPATISRGRPLKHTYLMFAGPKQRNLLAQYGPGSNPANAQANAPRVSGPINLSELIYYGWAIWAWFAKPLSYVLQFFARLGNYGLAIILLTVVVRSSMFPLSRKQALGAQKMQELQPEMKKITEKFKNDQLKRHQAMQELWRKHNYHPMAGCLPMLLQLPIFIGLYRALMIDINLRQAPLINEAFGWCTNLAAPDMLFRWSTFMPEFIVNHMGPYFNLLPILTVILFLWQQKMFMPPPADENAAMQQKMMQYMMIFMGYMFFTVPSGLCIYFIASSLWGIAERKLLPKSAAAGATEAAAAPAPAAVTTNGKAAAAVRRKKRRNR